MRSKLSWYYMRHCETVAESESDIRITTDTPYYLGEGELWGVYYEDFGENWPRNYGNAQYINFKHKWNLCDWITTFWVNIRIFAITSYFAFQNVLLLLVGCLPWKACNLLTQVLPCQIWKSQVHLSWVTSQRLMAIHWFYQINKSIAVNNREYATDLQMKKNPSILILSRDLFGSKD